MSEQAEVRPHHRVQVRISANSVRGLLRSRRACAKGKAQLLDMCDMVSTRELTAETLAGVLRTADGVLGPGHVWWFWDRVGGGDGVGVDARAEKGAPPLWRQILRDVALRADPGRECAAVMAVFDIVFYERPRRGPRKTKAPSAPGGEDGGT